MIVNKILISVVVKGWFTQWTMKSNHGRWLFSVVRLHGPISVVRFFRNQFTKPLGPSLGVNQMWTMRSDHAPKKECAQFCNMCPKKAIMRNNIQV